MGGHGGGRRHPGYRMSLNPLLQLLQFYQWGTEQLGKKKQASNPQKTQPNKILLMCGCAWFCPSLEAEAWEDNPLHWSNHLYLLPPCTRGACPKKTSWRRKEEWFRHGSNETSGFWVQEEFGQCPQAHGVILGAVLELDLMILMVVFQLRISMTL